MYSKVMINWIWVCGALTFCETFYAHYSLAIEKFFIMVLPPRPGCFPIMPLSMPLNQLWMGVYYIASLLQTWKKRSTSLSFFKFADIGSQKDIGLEVTQVRCPVAWQLRSMLQRRSVGPCRWEPPELFEVAPMESPFYTILYIYALQQGVARERENKNTLLKFFN